MSERPMDLPAAVMRRDVCDALTTLLPGIDVDRVFEVAVGEGIRMDPLTIEVRYYRLNADGRRFLGDDGGAAFETAQVRVE